MKENSESVLLEIDHYLPEILRRIHRGTLLSDAWELTVPQLRALYIIAEHDSCNMGELARGLGIKMSSATGIIDRLVQHGLVERESNPNDRRVVCLCLTKAGKRAYNKFLKDRQQRMSAALYRLSAAEQQSVAAAFKLLYQSLAETDPDRKE